MKERKNIKFRMAHINIEQFAILKPSLPSDGEIKFGFSVYFKAASDKAVVAPVVKIIFADSKEDPFVLLDVLCIFEIEQDSWNTLIQKDGNAVISKDLVCHMLVHTVGTARGIMHCKTISTNFNGLIIPAINVEDYVTKDLIIPAIKP